jgi:hypothetical protein
MEIRMASRLASRGSAADQALDFRGGVFDRRFDCTEPALDLRLNLHAPGEHARRGGRRR